MFEKLRSRFIIVGILVLLMFAALIIKMNNIMIVHSGDIEDTLTAKTTKTITVTGERGKILDVNGVPLAMDQKCYNITFTRSESLTSKSKRSIYTQKFIELYNIITSNGGDVIDTFVIDRNEHGDYYFNWGDISEDAAKSRESRWRTNMYVSTSLTAEEVFLSLCDRYQIPTDLPFDEIKSILSIWQEIQLNSYLSYLPITISYNVTDKCIAEVESKSDTLTGISIEESTARVYTKSSTAAHIIGYMGKMTDKDTIDYYKKLGYSSEDFIGVTGIEKTMEETLSANLEKRQGEEVVETNVKGTVTSVLSTLEATNGSDVFLTIDLNLQMILDKALEENIKQVRDFEEQKVKSNPSKYADVRAKRDIEMCESGAAIVMDVKTGNILAMSSYPSYDLNLFSGGISTEEYKSLTSDSANPLLNYAISSKAAPGSIFKMVTAIAGLQEGVINAGTTIHDNITYTDGIASGQGPSCWSSVGHGNVDVVKALEVSCNYFFYTVAGKLGIDKINNWAEKLGLTSTTGIQLTGEATGQVGGQSILYDNTKKVNDQKTSKAILVYNKIIEYLKEDCKKSSITVDDSKIEEAATKIIKLAGETNEVGPQIRKIMSDVLGISETVNLKNYWYKDISDLLYEITWNKLYTVTSGIGQGISLITPIEAVRYIAAIANGGTVYNANLIDKVVAADGTVTKTEPTVYYKLDMSASNLRLIQEGMQEVVSGEDGGTAVSAFSSFKYKNKIAGKTGTAQTGYKGVNVDIENTAWFVCYAPREDPKIAVVVYLPRGYSGSKGAYTVQKVVEYYLDNLYGDTGTTTNTKLNSLTD